MVELEQSGFDVTAFLATQAWGEESFNLRQKTFLFAGRSHGLGFLSSEGPREAHCRFAGWEGSYHLASLCRRLCWRRGARGNRWVAFGRCH
jgi:hypothetical protein